jgi:hypothetical protein
VWGWPDWGRAGLGGAVNAWAEPSDPSASHPRALRPPATAVTSGCGPWVGGADANSHTDTAWRRAGRRSEQGPSADSRSKPPINRRGTLSRNAPPVLVVVVVWAGVGWCGLGVVCGPTAQAVVGRWWEGLCSAVVGLAGAPSSAPAHCPPSCALAPALWWCGGVVVWWWVVLCPSSLLVVGRSVG